MKQASSVSKVPEEAAKIKKLNSSKNTILPQR